MNKGAPVKEKVLGVPDKKKVGRAPVKDQGKTPQMSDQSPDKDNMKFVCEYCDKSFSVRILFGSLLARLKFQFNIAKDPLQLLLYICFLNVSAVQVNR